MAKYLFVYHGGSKPVNPRDGRKITRRWNNWFVSMGYAVGDGGNPVGLWTTVHPDDEKFHATVFPQLLSPRLPRPRIRRCR